MRSLALGLRKTTEQRLVAVVSHRLAESTVGRGKILSISHE